MISPGSTFRPVLSSVTVPSAATCWMVSTSSPEETKDFSFERKSSWPIVATRVFDPCGNGLLRCGCLRA